MTKNPLKVLFLSPEVLPFAKSGGLADVSGSLPVALKHLGLDIRVALPFYRVIREGKFETRHILKNMEVNLGGSMFRCDVLETRLKKGIPVYLIGREDLYDRPNLYGDARGDYYDNLERFSFFVHAALRMMKALSFDPDVVHCHDWQTGLLPPLLKVSSSSTSKNLNISTIFTIHNLGYQGLFSEEKLPLTGLSRADSFHPEGLEYWGQISLLKGGINYADAITTVSPTYAKEIQTPEYGMGMDGVLRRRGASLYGILNGVDYNVWDPSKDPYLSANYSAENVTGKRRCKKILLHKTGLDPSLDKRPLLGMISRLDNQKGLDLLIQTLDRILEKDVGFVLLGSGDKRIQDALEKAARRNPGSLGLHFGFNEPLAHELMAGADILLVPSRYEPCGLTQMYALKFGTVPVVRATGGLDDTISQFDIKTRKGNGFKFGPYESEAFFEATCRAIDFFSDAVGWGRLMTNGMKEDFSWDRSARSYLALYQSVHKKTPFQFST